MSKSILNDPALEAYLDAHCRQPDDVEAWINEQTAALGGVGIMAIPHGQRILLSMLVRLVDPDFAIELGTFTGSSSLAIARALSPGGRLLCCDTSDEWTGIARQAWDRAGVADRIELRIGPALDTLAALPDDQVIDFAFVDADKDNQIAYHEAIMQRLRPGGLLVVDNTLFGGSVVDGSHPLGVIVDAYNRHAADDPRLDGLILPVADGLTVLQRR